MAANGDGPFLDAGHDLQSSLTHIPEQHGEPQCCCGNFDCAFQRACQCALDRLDDDLRTAGRLGQVSLLLVVTLSMCNRRTSSSRCNFISLLGYFVL